MDNFALSVADSWNYFWSWNIKWATWTPGNRTHIVTYFLTSRKHRFYDITVWKPLTDLFLGTYQDGNPNLSVLQIWRVGCPLALINSALCVRTSSDSTWPTQATSSQWVLGSSNRVRLNLVNPPEPATTGNPASFRRLNNAHRVQFTAAASLRGRLACARMRFRISGFLAKNFLMFLVPFFWLHEWQARQRLEIRLLPPVALG